MDNKRNYHRPISVRVEEIRRMPDVKELPAETQMTINLKFSKGAAKEMVLYLINELLMDSDEFENIYPVEITGPSP